jgi:diguanylate cyclase (GGDEF)-like protein
MISIKKYLDQHNVASPKPTSGKAAAPLAEALDAYCAILNAAGEYAYQACPASGAALQAGFKRIQRELLSEVTSHPGAECKTRSEEELRTWAEATVRHLNEKAADARELLLVLAKAGEDAYDRDLRYKGQFDNITQQLNSIAHLDDLAQVRAVVMKSAAELRTSSAKMLADGEQSVGQLRAQISTYQNRLEEAEKVASRDSLTGLHNRMSVENNLAHRLEEGKTFSLMMLDLNDFKQVNDTFGHAAGDDLLKQFAAELSALSRSGDVVGRWGGDEFVLIVDSSLENAELRAQRVKEWACGEYTLKLADRSEKIPVSASIGIAESNPKETVAELLKRADEAMYREKKAAQKDRGKNKKK